MSKNRYYRVAVKNKNNLLSKQEICGSFGSGDIYITPTIKGSGKYGQIIAGVVLIAVSYYMGGFGAGAAQAGTGSTAYWGSVIGSVGISMVIGGVAQLLMTSNAKDTDQRNSSLFQGNATTVYQGTSVGLAYGRVLVSPMPVCISSNARDVNTYDGDIMSIGTVGVVTTFLYSYKEGTATLCGFSEFTDASIPPKKYRTAVGVGDMRETWGECTWLWQTTGQTRYSQLNCSVLEYSKIYINGSYYEDVLIPQIQYHFYFPCCDSGARFNSNSTKTQITETYNGTSDLRTCSSATGTHITTLSDEDTESDAINRLLNSLEWSAWQETPVYSYQEIRTTRFSFGYRKVRMKTTTTTKYNPNLTYTYSITVQRRLEGTSDPWVDAETIEGMTKPDSSGDIIFPDVDNPAGYETRISTSTISI